MKKYLLLLVITTVSLSSCLKEGNDPYKDAQEQLVKDEEIIKKFIADNNIDALRHESGVYYQIVAPGSGSHTYTGNSRTSVNYTGRLLNGNVFDYSRSTATFSLGGVIVGWQIGVPLIQKGGKIRLLIPSGYAYGAGGSGSIPANAVLDFDIELVDVQ
ncbi:FKBP-type peptidyl-prolyl cis-trans isomerase [Pedobacter cryophilus]|uniref:Peptidyl-prolyl cis-trans isomerase n=1 Tax=Pedobacter cryophilus TaxID=2571271 RepID=A0A4U1C6U2_9SPHI|nr:FKBP-type peptidyl-prolyl cis-trans isomerase [Pedobacter cryophilus]TKC01045.1 peptidylprolyl isomerase [Pedobacter cryophilus]